ncbi:MAG: glycosyltransferase family 2 protein [Selenomonadaceae bacterium]|nr:glycosyltransferase family 2 protein [Selenomonadaceae bacterium]
MPKIVTISMVKNEADIIESFVRHTLTFADEMIICDHMSDDNTLKILELMQAEGQPIIIHHFYRPEMAQAEVTNGLLREAINERGADYVVPLDADEFLVNLTDSEPVREIICRLYSEDYYFVHWNRFEPLYPDIDVDKFLLCRPAKKKIQPDTGTKVLVPASGWRENPYDLVTGAHYAVRYAKNGNACISQKVSCAGFAPKLVLAHYHWCSDLQYQAKMAVGWINLTANNTRESVLGAEYKPKFDKIAKGEMSAGRDSMMAPTEWERWDWQEPLCLKELKFSDLAKVNLLSNVMKAAESLAARYAENQVRALGKKVSIIILPSDTHNNDEVLIKETLAGISEAGAGCEVSEIVLLCSTEENRRQEKTKWIKLAGQYGLEQHFRALDFSSGDNYGNRLDKEITGDYIQFLEAGIRITHDKLIRQVATYEKMTEYNPAVVIATGIDNELKSMGIYYEGNEKPLTLLDFNKRNLQVYLGNGKPFYGGISAALFRRESMESVNWFSEAVVDGRFWGLSAMLSFFMGIHDRKWIGLSSASMVRVNLTARDELTNLVWWQIERLLLLDDSVWETDWQKDIAAYSREELDAFVDSIIGPQLTKIERLGKLNGVKENLLREMMSIRK